jgi:hypothetical protein
MFLPRAALARTGAEASQSTTLADETPIIGAIYSSALVKLAHFAYKRAKLFYFAIMY